MTIIKFANMDNSIDLGIGVDSPHILGISPTHMYASDEGENYSDYATLLPLSTSSVLQQDSLTNDIYDSSYNHELSPSSISLHSPSEMKVSDYYQVTTSLSNDLHAMDGMTHHTVIVSPESHHSLILLDIPRGKNYADIPQVKNEGVEIIVPSSNIPSSGITTSMIPTTAPTTLTPTRSLRTVSPSSVSLPNEPEEINTKEIAKTIFEELKRYNIPQSIFAQRVLCRSQGTVSDLLRNPKPWSKLKSGRDIFRKMWKWLQKPEHERISALRQAEETMAGFSTECSHTHRPGDSGIKRKKDGQTHSEKPQPKRRRLFFTDLQRCTLQAIFQEIQRPPKEMQATIARQLGLETSTVSNFFMNARRRSLDKYKDDDLVARSADSSNDGQDSPTSDLEAVYVKTEV